MMIGIEMTGDTAATYQAVGTLQTANLVVTTVSLPVRDHIANLDQSRRSGMR
jgi:hypothetical protein